MTSNISFQTRFLKKALIVQLRMPDEFDAYVVDCITIYNQIRAHHAAQDATPRNQGGQFASNSTAPSTSSTSTGTQPGPMELSAARKRGPLTATQKKRRRNNSLCLYCGSLGHWATTCPQKRQRRTTVTATTQEQEGGVPLPPAINSSVPVPAPAPTINSAICVSLAQILYEP